MGSRITTKYIAETFVMIVFIYLTMAGTFFYTTNRYAQNDQRERLSRNIEMLAGTAARLFEPDEDMEDAQSYIDLLAGGIDGTVLIVSVQGEILFSSSDFAVEQGAVIPPPILEQALTAGYDGAGLLPGVTDDRRLVLGRPILDSSGETVGCVFLAARPESASQLVDKLTRVFSLSVYAVMSLTLAVVYVMVRRMSTPLRSMSAAARRFGQGDFDVRVAATGDDEVAELAVAFNNMAESLARTEEMRRSFIANVSHDLKTPMTIISGFIDGILDGTVPPEEASKYLHLVSDEVRRLSRLVTTLLDLAKLESDEVEFKTGPFDLCETIRQVLISFEKVIGEQGLSLDLALDCDEITARGDPDAIYRVIYNIIDNAIKFTPQGGEIAITMEKREKMAVCMIKNTGEGIPKDELPKLFYRFYKSDQSRSLDKRGSGLGLYIAKSIIDRHGGTITAESEPGKFAAFIFTLPLAQPPRKNLISDIKKDKEGKEKELREGRGKDGRGKEAPGKTPKDREREDEHV
ncbi:MAG TPA: ATP-binding protein [Candidatus Acidoferrum sp.]|nr:ATP-binding protein [Candidatus Acidoferrum sp.]